MGFQRAGLLAWHLDACKSHMMVWSREALQTAGLPLPSLGCTLKLTSVICRRCLGSCLGSLNKGELNTESVQLLKGHLSPDFGGEERTVCGVRPQPLCRQKWWALSPLLLDRKQSRGVCAFEETLQVVGRPRGAGTMGIWNDFLFVKKKWGKLCWFFQGHPRILQGLVTYSWEG